VKANLGNFYERIAYRAFDKILACNPDVCCLFNHNPSEVLGRTTSGTLKLSADKDGLHYTCDLPDTERARDLKQLIKRGDINGCSFAFALGPNDDGWSEEEDENRNRVVVRTINNFASLLDVSIPVTYPAYAGTSVTARSTVIAAEVRSRAERIVRVQEIRSRRFPQLEPGVCFEDAIEARDVRRSRDTLALLLD